MGTTTCGNTPERMSKVNPNHQAGDELGTGTGARNVLVVDDDDNVRAVLSDVLEDEGFDVVGRARDGVEGVSLAVSLEPDVIVLDVRMPGLDGIAAARQIHVHLPGARLVMLSAYDEKTLRDEAREAGASAFLVKGCPLDDIVRAVAA
jgi:two-component system, response regulator PdtaR